MQLIIILLFILYFCLDTPMKVRLICIRCYTDLSWELIIQKLCHLKDEKTSSSNSSGSILSFSFMWIYLSVPACPTDIHLRNLSIAVLSHYSSNSSRKIARLQPCIHHALNPKLLLHLAVYFDYLFLPVACRDVWGLEGKRSRRRIGLENCERISFAEREGLLM